MIIYPHVITAQYSVITVQLVVGSDPFSAACGLLRRFPLLRIRNLTLHLYVYQSKPRSKSFYSDALENLTFRKAHLAQIHQSAIATTVLKNHVFTRQRPADFNS